MNTKRHISPIALAGSLFLASCAAPYQPLESGQTQPLKVDAALLGYCASEGIAHNSLGKDDIELTKRFLKVFSPSLIRRPVDCVKWAKKAFASEPRV